MNKERDMEVEYRDNIDSRIGAIEEILMGLAAHRDDTVRPYGTIMLWENILYCLKEIKKLRGETD